MQDNFEISKDFNLPPKETKKEMKFNKNLYAFIGIGVVALIILGFLGYQYIAPFGATVIYQFTVSDKDKISTLKGAEQSETIDSNATNALTIPAQTIRSNIVTFNLKLLSKKIDGVWVNLKFKGNPDEVKIGVKGDIKDPYLYKPLYNKVIEDLKNSQRDNGLIFWQKSEKFKSFSDFARKPPLDKLASAYFFDPVEIYSYQPVSSSLGTFSANKLLRASHELLIRVSKSPLQIEVEKQDQNLYKGPDILSTELYKENKLLLKKEIRDDGVIEATNLRLQSQAVKLELNDLNPGVYRLLLLDKSKGGDIRINSIKINQKNVIFKSPIFIVDDKPVSLLTTASQVIVYTSHPEGLQTLKINDSKDFEIAKRGEIYHIDLTQTPQNQATVASKLNKINIPKNDLVIKGDGVFTFDKNSFFNPDPLNSINLADITDASQVDYIIARYQKIKKEGDWNITQAYFDPKDINIDGDKLYFSLESPGLAQAGGEIIISSLEVTVDKPGWFNKPVTSSEELDTIEDRGFFGNIWTSATEFFGGIGDSITGFLGGIGSLVSGFFGNTWTTTSDFLVNLWPFGETRSTGSGQVPTPTAKPTDTPTPTPSLKEKVKITVQNGGGTPGIAAKYQDLLKDAGFKNVETGNALNIKNATISVNKDQEKDLDSVISEIESIMSKEYETIERKTTAEKDELIVILGELPSPTPTATPTPESSTPTPTP
ncbi:MAG: hypothetical protein A2W22_03470 [Candidatus Levybacteria bacterium RBG_16_35_11]|nr:MAG: hypothetical protein A2W22_03470 [Candidatus Levybacteria bacterium RBG_16_35_11]